MLPANRGNDRLSTDCRSIAATLHTKLRPFFDSAMYGTSHLDQAAVIVEEIEGLMREAPAEESNIRLAQLVAKLKQVQQTAQNTALAAQQKHGAESSVEPLAPFQPRAGPALRRRAVVGYTHKRITRDGPRQPPEVLRLSNTVPHTKDDLEGLPRRLQHAYLTMQSYVEVGEPVAPAVVGLMTSLPSESMPKARSARVYKR